MKIQLTPSELISQSSEMSALQGEYEALFGRVNSTLRSVNDSWSANLSNNFSGKVSSAQKSFANMTTLLGQGASVAANSAVTFRDVDTLLAGVINGTATVENINAYGNASREKIKSDADLILKNKQALQLAYGGTTNCKLADIAYTSASYVVNNINEHGWIYDAWQYGKAAVKIGKGLLKIVGSIAGITSIAGIGLAGIGILSASNDIGNALADIVYVKNDCYELVGTTNWLKDTLIENGGTLGEMVGNKEAGEMFGKLTYFGMDVVSLLNGVTKVTKAFGKVNTDISGPTFYSNVWGHCEWDDISNNKYHWYNTTDWGKMLLGVDANSTAYYISDAGEKVYSTIKKAYKVGKEALNL